MRLSRSGATTCVLEGSSALTFPSMRSKTSAQKTHSSLFKSAAQPHLADYPPRPTQFDLGKPTEGFDGEFCVREPGDLLQWWLPFRDGSRALNGFVALGTSASEETRQQVTQALNSFHVDG